MSTPFFYSERIYKLDYIKLNILQLSTTYTMYKLSILILLAYFLFLLYLFLFIYYIM